MWTSSDWDPSRTWCFLGYVYKVVSSACYIASDSLCVCGCAPKSMCNFSMSVDFLSHFSMGPPRDYLFTPMSSLMSVHLRLLSWYPGLYLSVSMLSL